MKWIVQLDYEFGEFEPNSIYFRRVCSDDIEYSFAYDTKREALEAFCVGQVAMNELRKEKEAEQKEEEVEKKCDKDITFCHDCARAKTCKQKVDKEKAFEESGVFLGKFGDTAFVLENKLEEALFKRFEERLNPRLEALEEAIRTPYIPFSVREAKDIVYKYQAKVEVLEKKVEELEKRLRNY